MGLTYFLSDFHLGTDGITTSREREKRIVEFLRTHREGMDRLYLVGDIWDYWFEYGKVIPKGYTRLLGILGELRDAGIDIHYFTGNHDMWMFHYLTDEFDIPIHRHPVIHSIQGKTFYIAHGDGLGPGDMGYKFIKEIFSMKACQWMFERIHPNTGLRIMKYFSGQSRHHTEEERFLGPEKEWLIQHSLEIRKEVEIDYFIYGHRHLAIDYKLGVSNSRYINLGDWLKYQTYAVFDGIDVSLKIWPTEERVPIME